MLAVWFALMALFAFDYLYLPKKTPARVRVVYLVLFGLAMLLLLPEAIGWHIPSIADLLEPLPMMPFFNEGV